MYTRSLLFLISQIQLIGILFFSISIRNDIINAIELNRLGYNFIYSRVYNIRPIQHWVDVCYIIVWVVSGLILVNTFLFNYKSKPKQTFPDHNRATGIDQTYFNL